jgi:dTDP-glucose 4,6-dehydratase/UDP-glucuronate decarboxylase
MANIIVAGGAGFIGSHLCKRLIDEGYDVFCIDNLLTGKKENVIPLLDNPRFHFLEHDITKPIDLIADRFGEIRAIFHLASPASPNHHSRLSYHALPMETMLVNTVGTLELLKLAESRGASFLFASTSETYGDPLEHPQKEEYRGNVSTIGPRSVYDEAKRFGETLTSYFGREKNLDIRIVRIFNTYGPHLQREDQRMIVNFIAQAIEGQPITIFGDGTQTRSLCYVDDMVEGLMRLMFNKDARGEVVNLGNPEEHTVLEYATLVKQLTNASSEIVMSEKLPEDDPLKRKPDITKAKNLLQWEPRVSLEEGLKKTIEYLRNA